jgi:hypothetical protein
MKRSDIHREIEEKETVERYVLNKLSPEERRAFQEHFFECEQCFEQARASTRFIAGVRAAARAGTFAGDRESPGDHTAPSVWRLLLKPAFGLSVATALLLAIALAWLWFRQVPALREEIALERQAREEFEQESRRSLESAARELEEGRRQVESERAARASVEDRLREIERRPAGAAVRTTTSPQANTPIITLESSRDSKTTENELVLPAKTASAVLWITVEPGNRFDSFTVQVLTRGRRPVETLAGAKPNRYGALTVSLPANRFQSGEYIVKLYGAKGRQSELVGEYGLRVVRK